MFYLICGNYSIKSLLNLTYGMIIIIIIIMCGWEKRTSSKKRVFVAFVLMRLSSCVSFGRFLELDFHSQPYIYVACNGKLTCLFFQLCVINLNRNNDPLYVINSEYQQIYFLCLLNILVDFVTITRVFLLRCR